MKNIMAVMIVLMAAVYAQNAAAQTSVLAPHTTTQWKTPSGANITNIETKGNLEVTHDLGCISLNHVKNDYTPADLYKSFGQCIKENNYADGLDIFLIAGAYGYFDKLRVADKSAHQATKVLIMNNTSFMSVEQKQQWKASIAKLGEPNSPMLLHTCNAIKKIGQPNYYPAYMIQHGMDAIMNHNDKPIVDNFNAHEAWESAIMKYLHCPA
jgi:hypothetical protein